MIKKLCLFMVTVFAVVFILTGCNFSGYDWVDTNYHFNYAVIKLQNGEIVEGKVDTWSDADGEQLTITFEDGTRYLTSSFNCTLIER